jgi:hypothetical protein
MPAVATVVECPRNPGVETALRCQQCDAPICPRCLVQSPVGAKCRDCARVMRSPIYTVRGMSLARSVAVAVIGGVVTGLIWGFVLLPFTIGFLSIFLGAGLGYVFTRMLEWASGRKRGPVMIGLAVLGIGIAWGVMWLIVPQQFAMYGLLAVGIGVYFSYQNLR